MKKILAIIIILAIVSIYFTFNANSTKEKRKKFVDAFQTEYTLKSSESSLDNGSKDFFTHLAKAAEERTYNFVIYDPSYIKLDYPGGDVPLNKGVCTDVIIRSYRKLGIDLQVKVHEDMKSNFNAYPKIWGLTNPDPNIDHRRVPNLMTFFKRHGTVLPITNNFESYKPGDVITWDLGQGITHIGIVSTKRRTDGKQYKIVHNIGAGPKLEDVLFNWKITGHFRYN